MWETWVQSLDWEDPLEKGKATHSSIYGELLGVRKKLTCCNWCLDCNAMYSSIKHLVTNITKTAQPSLFILHLQYPI